MRFHALARCVLCIRVVYSFMIMQSKAPTDIYKDLYSYLVINQKELNIKTISYFKYYFNLNKKIKQYALSSFITLLF